MRPTVIAIDFDETIAMRDENFVPIKLIKGAKEVINWLHDDLGCTIIIWTCRGKKILNLAKKFLDKNDIHYDKINENADTTKFPTSRKIYADIYIDDRALGTDSPVNWSKIKSLLKKSLVRRHKEEISKIEKVTYKINEDGTVCYTNQIPSWANKDLKYIREPYLDIIDKVRKKFKGKCFSSPEELFRKVGHEIRKLTNKHAFNFINSIKKQIDKGKNNEEKKELQEILKRFNKRYPLTDLITERIIKALEDYLAKKTKYDLVKNVIKEIKDWIRIIKSKKNASRGMPEAVQKMYDGLFQDHERSSYDQLGIMTDDRDWLNNEDILADVLFDERASKPKSPINSYPKGYDEYWESYYANPKQTGEKITPAILAPDQEEVDAILSGEKSHYTINDPNRNREEHKRDNTQKYKNTTEPLNNVMYWNKDNTYK